MTQRKKPDLNKILRSILLILGIVFMLLKISARASAAAMPDYVQDYLEDFLSEHNFPSTFDSYFQSAINDNCEYFILYKINGYYYLFLSPYERTFETRSTSYYWYPDTYRFKLDSVNQRLGSTVSTVGWSGFAYSFLWSNIGSAIKAFKYTITGKTGTANFNGQTVYSCYDSQTSLYSVSLSTFSNQSYSDVVCYGNMWIDTSGSLKAQENTIPDPVDSRFTAYTSIDQSGKKLLNVTWSSQAYPNTGSYTYQSSTIALQVAVNGQSSTVSFSSTDYPELFVSGNSSYIPYKFIQKLANIAIVQDTDTFYLEKITLTQQAYPSAAGSSASQTFTASTVYSLNLGADVVEIPSVPSVTPVPISETNIVETEYFNNIVGGTISSSDSFPIAPWANTYRVAIADGEILDSNNELNGVYYDDCITNEELESFLGSISSSDPSLNVNSIVNFETYSLPVYLWDGLNYFNYFHKLVYDNIKDFADIAIYDLYYPSTTLRKRFVIYTDSYYYKLQLQSLGSLQNMIESNTYYVKALYDYSFTRFNGMAESLESMRISNNNLLSSINANILNLQDLVSSGTDRIVNAIDGISSGGGGMSVSDLSGALNTLFMPSFEWDQVNYQDYLDSMGVLALPFEFVFDTQSIIKNNYSASIVMPVNDFSVPLGKDFSDNDIEFTVFEDQEDFAFVPTSIFPAALWSVFQYLAAFGLVIGEAWFTYVHIFRKEEKSGDF